METFGQDIVRGQETRAQCEDDVRGQETRAQRVRGRETRVQPETRAQHEETRTQREETRALPASLAIVPETSDYGDLVDLLAQSIAIVGDDATNLAKSSTARRTVSDELWITW
jgi:hypothetical protein